MTDKDKAANESLADKTRLLTDRDLSSSAPSESATRLYTGNTSTSSDSLAEQSDESLYLLSSANRKGMSSARDLAKQAAQDQGALLKERFVLESILGQGGMGVVYRAKDLRKVEAEDHNPYVAAKVLNESFKQHPKAFMALQQETAKTQQLAHPNIVTVYDFDRDGSTLYMTMELLEGTPLDKLLAKHRDIGLDKNQAIAIFNDLCAALSYAHNKGIIHSDFKPGNIFITQGQTVADQSAKVLDFGIARAASQKTTHSAFDAAELSALTPAYASLAMLEGKEPHYSDDVYALGCVFYEMLSGTHPYQRQPANIALEKGLKPKKITSLSNSQWKALEKALALKADARWQEVNQFRTAFNPPRHRFWLQAVGGALVVTIALVGWLVFQQYQEQQQFNANINEKLQQAQVCFDAEDFICAKDLAGVVVNLAPDNNQARQLYQAASTAATITEKQTQLDALFDQASQCFDTKDYECAQVKTSELLTLSPEHEPARALLAMIAEAKVVEEITEQLTQADACLSTDDLPCAILFLTKAEQLDANHGDVVAMQQRLASLQQQRANEAQQRQQSIDRALAAAQRCQQQQDYLCVITQSEKVLAIDASHAPAIQLQQQARLTLQGIEQNRATVTRMLAQAESCLQQKNYSCAIARSESALDILPNSAAAKAMKAKAELALQQIKQSITIQ